MKKIAVLIILISLIFIPKITFAVAQNIKIPQKVKIITRQEWGANEELTLEKTAGKPTLQLTDDQNDEEQTDIIEKIVGNGSGNRTKIHLVSTICKGNKIYRHTLHGSYERFG